MRGAKSLASYGSCGVGASKKRYRPTAHAESARGNLSMAAAGLEKIEPRMELVETLSRCSGISWDRWDQRDSSGGYRLDRGNHSNDRICRCASHGHSND